MRDTNPRRQTTDALVVRATPQYELEQVAKRFEENYGRAPTDILELPFGLVMLLLRRGRISIAEESMIYGALPQYLKNPNYRK